MPRQGRGSSRVAVVLASAGRPELLGQLVGRLQSQTLAPDEIHVVVPTSASLPELPVASRPADTVQIGPSGLARQRNAGIDALSANCGIVFFFDDDAIPRQDFIENAVRAFEQDPDLVGLTGAVAIDGARIGRQVSVPEALRVLALSESGDRGALPVPTDELYGCNFAVRASVLGAIRFDDRLPLYSWLEDLDFSRRLALVGTLAAAPTCVVAHLGSQSGGRVQHERFGYSQVVNPAYLWRKGSLVPRDVATLVMKPVASNVALSVLADRTSRAWRRQRLRGNLRAAGDLLRGRLQPERILTFD